MTRDQFLADRLRRFLTERRVAPRSLSSPQAQADEIRALSRIVLSRAPVDGFEEWWDEVEMFIGSHAETRAWPTEKEMLAATSAARGPARQGGPREEFKLNPAAIAAQRIRQGDAVGDGWLYGRLAVEMLDGGYISETELRPARVAFYHAMKDIWGDEEADRRVAEFQRNHEAAKAVARGDVDAFKPGGKFAFRPRLMSDAIAGPKPGRADFVVEEDKHDPLTDGPRPYTDAERARMARLRPQQPTNEETAHG